MAYLVFSTTGTRNRKLLFCYNLSFVYFPRYTTPRKEVAPTPPQRKIIEERMVTREMIPPVQAAPPSGPREPKQRITQEELTIEEVRKLEGTPAVAYSRPPPSNEYRYQEEMLPPPDEYHFEEKRTEMVAVPPEAMDSRKSEYAAMLSNKAALYLDCRGARLLLDMETAWRRTENRMVHSTLCENH